MSTKFHSLSIKNVHRETPLASTVTFEVPASLSEAFHFTQGQYLTLKFNLKGKEVRRAYSMCTSPLDNHLSVTVKRIDGGLVSNHINQNLKAGDTVDVMPPQGKFFIPIDAEAERTYYLFGGGSGITPLMSILKTVLHQEPKSRVNLLYGNLNEENIIFRELLAQVQQKFPGRLVVDHILEKPHREKAKGLGGLFKKGKISWEGKVGIPDGLRVGEFLDTHPSQTDSVVYFICGPGKMMDSVESVLASRGIDRNTIHIERFSSTPPGEKPQKTGVSGAQATVILDGKEVKVTVSPKQSILEALQDANYDPPYSCASGVCSTCMAKLTQGAVEMDDAMGLEDTEIDAGYILTCQAHPTTETVALTYDFSDGA